MLALLREIFLPGGVGGGLLEDAGGGAAAPLAGEEVAGGAVGGVLEREAVDGLVFSGTDGTRGSGRSLDSEPAPMLTASVSSISGGEVKSSSAR
jgi:hypothetical protein